MTDPLQDPRVEQWGVIVEAQAAVNRALAADIQREFGWHMSWFEVLLRLARTPGGRMRMSDLADAVSFSSGGFTRLADRIEQAGLIRREACPADRRSWFAVLTENGTEKITRAAELHSEGLQQHYFGLLDDRGIARVDGAMRHVREAHRRTAGSPTAQGTAGSPTAQAAAAALQTPVTWAE